MAIDKGDLSELNEIFKGMGGVEKIEDFTNNFTQIEDGTYTGEILKVEPKNAKNTGRPMIDITLGLEGEKKEHVYLSLAGKDLNGTQRAIARTVKQLKELDITGITPEDFVNNSLELVGTRISLEVTTTNGFQNKWLTLA